MLRQNTVECTYCNSLESLSERLDCSILDMALNKYSSVVHNTQSYFDQILMNDLVRYRRILNRRLYNNQYPCCTINLEDIITKATLLSYSDNCNKCQDCFPLLPGTTSTTTTTTSSTTTTTTTSA